MDNEEKKEEAEQESPETTGTKPVEVGEATGTESSPEN